MNGFFNEVARTNRAYCHAQGIATPAYDRQLSDEELNGKTLSEAELECALVIDLDLAHAVGEETKWLMMRNPSMSLIKANRWALVNVRTGVSNKPHAVIEYAQTDVQMAEAMELFAESLGKYYADCRSRGTPAFVGD